MNKSRDKKNLISPSSIAGQARLPDGQVLIEILIGLFVTGILITAATAAVVAALRSNLESKNFQAASALSQKLIDDVKTVVEANWRNIYDLGKGSGTRYYVAVSSTTLIVLPGFATTTIGNIIYTNFFSVENVKRLNGAISTDPAAVDDPSTQKIVSHAQWLSADRTSEAALTIYLTRWRNLVSRQTDWSGGAGQAGPVVEFNQNFFTSTNINCASSTGSIIIQEF